MTLRESLLTLARSLPAETPVPVPAGELVTLLAGNGAPAERSGSVATRLDTDEAALRLGVKAKTVANWCAAGRFPGALKTGAARGKWTIPASAVNTWLREHGSGIIGDG